MSSVLVQAVGWALLHFVWQGALVAAVLAIALSVAPVRAARVRYGLACAALLAMVPSRCSPRRGAMQRPRSSARRPREPAWPASLWPMPT